MNKQELIKKLKDWQSTYMSMQIAIKLAEQLDEPGRAECENISQDRQFICSSCNWGIHALNRCLVDLSDEGDNGYYAYDVNYCPNCGAKIKREKRDE